MEAKNPDVYLEIVLYVQGMNFFSEIAVIICDDKNTNKAFAGHICHSLLGYIAVASIWKFKTAFLKMTMSLSRIKFDVKAVFYSNGCETTKLFYFSEERCQKH